MHIYKTSSRVDLIACTLYIVHESSTLMKTQVAIHDTGPRYHQRPHNDMKKGTSSLAKCFYVLKPALRRIVNKSRVASLNSYFSPCCISRKNEYEIGGWCQTGCWLRFSFHDASCDRARNSNYALIGHLRSQLVSAVVTPVIRDPTVSCRNQSTGLA